MFQLCLQSSDVNPRETFGHWESDSVIDGDQTSGLNIIVERKYFSTNISFMQNKAAVETKKAINRRLSNFPCELIKSVIS